MSSKRAAEELSFAGITIILEVLADIGKSSGLSLYKAVIRRLPPPQKQLLKQKGGKRRIYKLLYYLKSRHYIEYTDGSFDTASYLITNKGLERLEKLSFKALQLRGNGWDQLWRILTFDIPEENRAARDALRRLIKQLGFVQLHKSVWIQPLPCQAEIRKIQSAYGVEKHITLLEVRHFDQEQEFKQKFRRLLVSV